MTALLLFLGGFVTGILALIGYGCYRGVNSDGWDDSNMLNWIRLFSHVVMHPEDFAEMYYLTPAMLKAATDIYDKPPTRPFWYVSNDEFSENFPQSRPEEEEPNWI